MAKKPTVSDQLREAIEASGKSRYRISKETGIPQSALSRFIHGSRGLSFDNIDKLCAAIGVELIVKPEKKGRKGG